MNTSGTIIKKIKGFRYTYNHVDWYTINFDAVKIRMSLYNDAFNCIAFTYSNSYENSLCTFILNNEGEPVNMANDSIVDVWREHFNSDYPLTSVNFQNTNQYTSQYPYMWVTTGGFSPPSNYSNMVHAFAVNDVANFAYLGSTGKPFNSDWYFHNLLNLTCGTGFYDLFTIEEWSDTYGLRKYLPFTDIHSDYITNYCSDSTDFLLWKGAFTNDCFIRVTAERKSGDSNCVPVEISSIDGFTQPSGTYSTEPIFRFKGYTSLTDEDPIEIKLNLPLKDYVFGASIKIHAKLYPDYDPTCSGEYTNRDYETPVNKFCLPRPGGCPFLYVKDVNQDYIADNNILHKSEFSDGDITDMYKLRINPDVSNREIELALVENENDYGYINMAKLYAIDHSSSQKMAITENNDIVLYDSAGVIASDSVMFNNVNITPNVNFHNPYDTTIGGDGDQLYAHFSYGILKSKYKNLNSSDSRIKTNKERVNKTQKQNNPEKTGDKTRYNIYTNEPVAFIANVGNLVYPNSIVKNNAGRLMASSINGNPADLYFARRELNSEIVIPLYSENDYTNYINITWLEDFSLKYIGVTNNLSYSGYTKTAIPISEARRITSTVDSNIIDLISSIDELYGEVNDSALIKMKFDARNLPVLGNGFIREYVFEVNGRYNRSDNNSMKKGNNEIPLTYKLSQNYPNPFNPITKIKFEIPKTNMVNIVIYDILGREVKRLVNNEMKQAGRYVVEFDGTNYASGVYFYRIEAGNFVQSKKMVLLK